MKLNISKSASITVQETSTFLNISAEELIEQLIESHLMDRLVSEGTIFLSQVAMMQKYSSHDEAEVVAERIKERSALDKGEGTSEFLVSAEVIEVEGFYYIDAEQWHPNSGEWSSAIPVLNL
jgi:hypothetical protein